ncbi:hypothetical protein B0G77_0382 [Paraburkholderia sp. BL10I2N1]|nr:hypothetical protein B0G77_0382 [Paraburkholderia sp. BL10I2N1]
MKVFLDDERATPEGWHRVYWPPEAIRLLEMGSVEEMSLDHGHVAPGVVSVHQRPYLSLHLFISRVLSSESSPIARWCGSSTAPTCLSHQPIRCSSSVS